MLGRGPLWALAGRELPLVVVCAVCASVAGLLDILVMRPNHLKKYPPIAVFPSKVVILGRCVRRVVLCGNASGRRN